VGGFPGCCLAGGFSGLVAPLWNVKDTVARRVALDFYSRALATDVGGSIAEIIRDIRSKYDPKNPIPTYLAYVYYGNPALRLSRTPAIPVVLP
jgi:hypothetical protein